MNDKIGAIWYKFTIGAFTLVLVPNPIIQLVWYLNKECILSPSCTLTIEKDEGEPLHNTTLITVWKTKTHNCLQIGLITYISYCKHDWSGQVKIN